VPLALVRRIKRLPPRGIAETRTAITGCTVTRLHEAL
jgi:hypothetical protein